MSYEDSLPETPFDIMINKVKELEGIGFSNEEASRFATLQFRAADSKVVLPVKEENVLALFKEKQEELLSILKSDTIVSNMVKITRNGFSPQKATKFASFLCRSQSQDPVVNLTKSQEDELEVYKKEYYKLSPGSYFDIVGEKYLEQPSSGIIIEDTSGQREKEENKMLKNIHRKLMTGEPLDPLEKMFQQKHMKKNN